MSQNVATGSGLSIYNMHQIRSDEIGLLADLAGLLAHHLPLAPGINYIEF